MYEKDFERIINASKNHSLTFFVGAGVSCISGAPSWKNIIDKICTQIGKPIQETYSSDENLKLAQMLYIHLNKDKYNQFMEECIPNNLLPNDIHKKLFVLNPVSFITTNFDELLETAAMQECQNFISIVHDKEVATINGSKYILKIHGDIKHKNIVFKEEDYLNYSNNFKLIETLLKSIFSTNTVVFIGYGLNDYNVKLILNWAKSLLQEQFNKPIFIYTGEERLEENELSYHDSRGLNVIDWHQITNINKEVDDYIQRYLIVLNAIKRSEDISLERKNKYEAFDILYQILSPLDDLQALRTTDIREKLGKYIYIGEYNITVNTAYYNEYIIIQYFYELCCLSPSEFSKLDISIQNKHKMVLNVFIKARIYYLFWNSEQISLQQNIDTPFADQYCLHFDYAKMRNFVANNTEQTDKYNFKKAFYLYRLRQYNESYKLFSKIGKKAYLSKDYLLYYLCEINRINLNIIKQNYSNSVNSDDTIIENHKNVFESLPQEFQNKYFNLKDMYSVKHFLYAYSYRAFMEGKKLKNSTESNSIEFGYTSSHKAMHCINEYLHFLLGNGIVLDSFNEYTNPVKYLMDLLVHKYSEQNKKHIRQTLHSIPSTDKISFDDIDFYCFIEYFDKEEIIQLFSKHQIEFISFNKQHVIDKTINNILANYEYLDNNQGTELNMSIQQIKKLLVLLSYVDISQRTMDCICDFMLKSKFYEYYNIIIDIKDYVLFFDKQIFVKKLYSQSTSTLLTMSLLHYLDTHIKLYESYSNNSLLLQNDTGYYNLVFYIYPQNERKNIHALCMRVSYIIQKNIKEFIPSISNYYWNYLSPYMKHKVYEYAKQQLSNKFNFDIFGVLSLYNKKIEPELITSLKKYLNDGLEKISIDGTDSNSKNIYDELGTVGYWCLRNWLNKDDFIEFTGISNLFDFFILYDKFDYTKFDISWLMYLYPNTLKYISKNKLVKKKISSCIINMLNTEKILSYDESKLVRILTQYFF